MIAALQLVITLGRYLVERYLGHSQAKRIALSASFATLFLFAMTKGPQLNAACGLHSSPYPPGTA